MSLVTPGKRVLSPVSGAEPRGEATSTRIGHSKLSTMWRNTTPARLGVGADAPGTHVGDPRSYRCRSARCHAEFRRLLWSPVAVGVIVQDDAIRLQLRDRLLEVGV